MSDQSDNQEANQLSRVNAELTQSLKRCRLLLNECRSKLAANSNEPESLDCDETEQHESDHA
jgi:hypothetical protein